MWAVIETYYKHGEYKLKIFQDDGSLMNFLIDKIKEYNIELEKDENNNDILYLIDLVEANGNYRVDNQEGWGVREIREI